MTRCLSLRYLRCFNLGSGMTVLTVRRPHESESSFKVSWLILSVDGGLFARKEISSIGFDLSIELPRFLVLSVVVSLTTSPLLPSIGRFLAPTGLGITVWKILLLR